ncbi:MAG: hypothetical protein AAB909_05060, partial [Patescibacteria group bacterium]
MKSKANTLIYISRAEILLCASHHVSPVRIPLPPTCVQDLEIKNHEELNKILEGFLAGAKLHPGIAIFIFDDSVSFVKDFGSPHPPSPEEVQKFLDTVPLRSVSGKLFKAPGGYKLVAVNRELFESLSKQF